MSTQIEQLAVRRGEYLKQIWLVVSNDRGFSEGGKLAAIEMLFSQYVEEGLADDE